MPLRKLRLPDADPRTAERHDLTSQRTTRVPWPVDNPTEVRDIITSGSEFQARCFRFSPGNPSKTHHSSYMRQRPSHRFRRTSYLKKRPPSSFGASRTSLAITLPG